MVVLGRYVAYIVGLAVCMLVCVWVRIDAREAALGLSRSQSLLERAEVENERLVLELASLENVTTLREKAQALALDDNAPVIEVW
jgi:cell division protein FtsL